MSSNEVDRLFTQACKKLFHPSSSILVAVSGGGDSMALLELFWQHKKSLHISRLAVAHVNHGLRSNAIEEERYVCSMAQKHRIPIFVGKLKGKQLGQASIEEWARNQRYRYFLELKKKHGFDYIATGHTADDQAETLILNLMRGTGLNGLVGIESRRQDGIIRPLLWIERRQLRQWLKCKGIDYYDDPTNDDQTFRRNWIRHQILPLLNEKSPGATRRIAACAISLETDRQIIEQNVKEWMQKNVISAKGNRFALRRPGCLDTALASRCLVSIFRDYGIALNRPLIEDIIAAANRTRGFFELANGWKCRIGTDTIDFFKGVYRLDNSNDFSFTIKVPSTFRCPKKNLTIKTLLLKASEVPSVDTGSNKNIAFLDAAKVATPLVYRRGKADETFVPLGRKRKAKLGDFLKKQRLNLEKRNEIGVIVSATNEIVWIPGIRISEQHKVTSNTDLVLKLSLIKN